MGSFDWFDRLGGTDGKPQLKLVIDLFLEFWVAAVCRTLVWSLGTVSGSPRCGESAEKWLRSRILMAMVMDWLMTM